MEKAPQARKDKARKDRHCGAISHASVWLCDACLSTCPFHLAGLDQATLDGLRRPTDTLLVVGGHGVHAAAPSGLLVG